MDEKQKVFIKQSAVILTEIYSGKISELMRDILDEPDTSKRDRKIDAINILRDWLREIDMIEKGKEIKPTTFI